MNTEDRREYPSDGKRQCSPTVAADARYPHELVLSCWEHGTICPLGYSVKADYITEQVESHRARLGEPA